MEHMEIEKKYKIKHLPENLDQYPTKKIVQGYLNGSPVVRVRQSNDRYILTYKGSGMMAREEYNLPLDEASFHNLIQKINGRLIEKTRYVIPLSGGLTAELDIFEGCMYPLQMVEVEFDSIEAAEAFTPPEWFAEEVTNDYHYHNSYMALGEE